MGIKIAVTGKGGAGKTMISSCLAYLFSSCDEQVYAIDADPNPTLGQALGFPDRLLNTIKPLLSLKELIKERTGAATDSFGSYFTLNPYVSDIPENYSACHRSIKLLIMGATRGANTGCACAENSITKALVSHLILRSSETVLLDMVAGTEHMGRGTASSVDAFITVIEPSMRSIQAGKSIIELSKQINGFKNYIIGNKIKNQEDEDLLRQSFPYHTIAGILPWKAEILKAENDGVPVFDRVPEIVQKLQDAVKVLNLCKS